MSKLLHGYGLGIGTALLTLSALVAQTPVPPIDPTLPEHLKELKSMIGEHDMGADFQAIGLMQKLTATPEAINPKDREKVAKGLGDVFRTGKVRTGDKEILYRETSDGLAKLAEDGAKYLMRAIEDPRFKDSVPLQAHMMLALGKTQAPKQIEFLLDTLVRSPHDELRAASGEALGEYDDMDNKVRHDVVKTMIRSWGSLNEKATQAVSSDPSAPINLEPENARKTLRAVESKWVATLHKLTGVSMSAFADWQRWLNKNPNWVPPPSTKKP